MKLRLIINEEELSDIKTWENIQIKLYYTKVNSDSFYGHNMLVITENGFKTIQVSKILNHRHVDGVELSYRQRNTAHNRKIKSFLN